MTTQDIAKQASTDLKALVWAEYHNDREVAYKAVAEYCATHDIYTDGSISQVMYWIYEYEDNKFHTDD
jgi:hypothetical protein